MTEINESTTVLQSRLHQAFPSLTAIQIDAMRPFGVVRQWADGEMLFRAGETGPGMFVVLSGNVLITRRDGRGGDVPVVTQGAGDFLAEVGQLSGKPALADGRAAGPVEALLIAPDQLRALLVAEAEIGELVMRAPVRSSGSPAPWAMARLSWLSCMRTWPQLATRPKRPRARHRTHLRLPKQMLDDSPSGARP